MAIYHAHGQIISRSAGRSAVAAAAYRSGNALFDQRLGKEFDYTRKSAVDESVILLPEGAPEWLRDRGLLWNAVEAAERRRNSQTSREFEFALPIELVRKDPEAAKNLLKDFARDMFVIHGMIADINFHDMKSHNPHGHMMLTMRLLHPCANELDEGSRYVFGEKAREFNDRGYMDFWREAWADYANAAMAAHGIDARIDHRSLVDQGITDREPGIHVGPDAWAMAEREVATGRWEANAVLAFERFAKHQETFASVEGVEAQERRKSEEQAEKEAAEGARQQDMIRIAGVSDRLRGLGQRLDAALETAMNRASGALMGACTALDEAAQTSVVAKKNAFNAATVRFSGAAAITHREDLAKAGKTVTDLTVRMDGAVSRSLGWNNSESWLGGGFLIQVEEPVPDQAPAVQKWVTGYTAEEDKSPPAASLAAMSARLDNTAPQIEKRSRELDSLALRLHAAGLKLVERAREQFAPAEERLKAQRPAMIGKIANAATSLAKLSERFDSAAPRLDRDHQALSGLGARLEAVGPEVIRRAQRQLAPVEERLKAYQPTMIGNVVGNTMRGLIKIGETAHSVWSGVKAAENDDCMERSRVSAPQEISPKTSKSDPLEPEYDVTAYARSMAQDLVWRLENERGPWQVRRSKGRYLLDPALISSPYNRERAIQYGDHELVRKLLIKVERIHTDRLLKLLAGQEPVVRITKRGFVFTGNEETQHLAALANELFNDGGQFEGLAKLAIERWSRGERQQVVASTRQARPPQSEGARSAPARTTESAPAERDDVAHLSRLISEGKKGFGQGE